MTLLLSAVTPEGIVLGSDSALTWTESGETLCLLGFNKCVPVPRLHMGISIAGAARIPEAGTESWVSTWVKRVASELEAQSFQEFCDQFVDRLAALPDDLGLSVFQVAAWAIAHDENGTAHMTPRLAQVTNESGEFSWSSLLPDEFTTDLIKWRLGDKSKGYPVRFAASGMPQGYAPWVTETATPAFSEITGLRIPNPEITALAEYVRFLIKLVADLHRISREPAHVGEPIETLLLFPDSKNMFSIRQ